MTGGVILIQPQRKAEPQDVRDLVASAVDAFCEQFGISGPERKDVYLEIANQAQSMAESIPPETWPCNDCGLPCLKGDELCGPCYEKAARAEDREGDTLANLGMCEADFR